MNGAKLLSTYSKTENWIQGYKTTPQISRIGINNFTNLKGESEYVDHIQQEQATKDTGHLSLTLTSKLNQPQTLMSIVTPSMLSWPASKYCSPSKYGAQAFHKTRCSGSTSPAFNQFKVNLFLQSYLTNNQKEDNVQRLQISVTKEVSISLAHTEKLKYKHIYTRVK